MTRHALVTGATGGLGRTLVPALLASGYRVRATGRDARIGEALATQGADFITCDLTSDPLTGLVAGADTVFHLAALSSPWGRRAEFEAINVTATARLLEAAKAAGVTQFVHASTPSIYAEPRDRLNLTEEDAPAHPFANAYAATKYAAERCVIAANGTDMTTMAIRPRAIVGPDDSVLLPRLLRAARSGRIRLPGGGKALIELTDVRDVAAAFIAADCAGPVAAGQVFNISGGTPRTLSSILQTIFAVLDRPVRIGSVSPATAMALARMAEVIARRWPGMPEPPLTRYTVMTLAWSQTFDLSKAKDLLHWSPSITPEDAITHALAQRHKGPDHA